MARGRERVNRRGKRAGAGPGVTQDTLRLRLLGPLAVFRGAQGLPLPQSRQVRALLAYLALAPRPAGRSQLCELLWNTPDDPRGALRWCLSRLRSVVGARVVSADDSIALDLAGCAVDAVEVERAARAGIEALAPERLRELARQFEGDFLEGLEIDRSPAFGSWLTAQRRRFRAVQAALLERLAAGPDDDEAFGYLDQWLELAPFDRRVHEMLLTRLAGRGRLREGEEHLERAAALFDAEGLEFGPIAELWRTARTGASASVIPSPSVIPSEARDLVQRDSSLTLGMTQPHRRSIAVMPFADLSAGPSVRGGIADALAHDVTTRLAKLRSMFVIAQGSTFALAERRIGPEEAGRMLNVDYVVGGSVRLQGQRLEVTVELVETRSARIVWSEVLNHDFSDAFFVLDDIGNRIVASIAGEVETLERNRAILRPPSSLDAWESHHRGLWHMYRFTRADNERARHFFEGAVRLDPTFARAYAGLSFTHFQDAFLGWGDRKQAIDRAFDSAGQSLMVDERDPAAHWAMGRALWLRGSNDDAVVELERTIDLSPNFALGHYTLSFVQAQSGDPGAAIASADASRALSPFDPLLFAMFGSRAIALARLGKHAEAADWAVKAAARPNAHPHIYAIAACTLALAGRLDEARVHAAAVRRSRPGYVVDDFLQAFRFDGDGAALFRQGAKAVGMQ
jgi:DNA-binding SARP family transcriptional activator